MEKQADNSGRRCWASLLLGLTLAGIAGTATLIDLRNNHAFGAQISPELGMVMALAAVSLTCLPAAAALLGRWDVLLRVGAILAVLLTALAAISAYADKQGKQILANQTTQRAYDDALTDAATAREEIRQAREEAAAINEIAGTADLESLAALQRDQIAKESSKDRGGCGPACRKAEEALQAVLSRMPAARTREAALGRAEAAQGRLDSAKGEAKKGTAEVSMLATVISRRTGYDAAEVARDIALAVTGFSIAVTLVMALLMHSATTLVMRGLGLRSVPAPALGQELAEPVRNPFATPSATPCNPVALEPEKAKKSSRAYWLARLRNEFPAVAKRVEAGEISCHAGCIETGLRKAPAKRVLAPDWTKASAYLDA